MGQLGFQDCPAKIRMVGEYIWITDSPVCGLMHSPNKFQRGEVYTEIANCAVSKRPDEYEGLVGLVVFECMLAWVGG